MSLPESAPARPAPAPLVLRDTGERMVPEFHKGELIYAEHLTRYESALSIVAGLTVLDIASGAGYGSQILAGAAKHVYGVDRDAGVVGYAQRHFAAPNLEFRVGDAVAIPLPDDSVDVVVTFETIEHVGDYRGFVAEIKRVMRSDGIALISTPNDLEFAEGNHFHLHEFEYDELLELLGPEFVHIEPWFQATWKYVAVGTEATFANEGVVDIPTVNLAPLERDKYLYFYLVCSNRPIERSVTPTAALGGHFSDRALIAGETAAREKYAQMEARAEASESRCAAAEAELAAARAELHTVMNGKLMRYSATLRAVYGRALRARKRVQAR